MSPCGFSELDGDPPRWHSFRWAGASGSVATVAIKN